MKKQHKTATVERKEERRIDREETTSPREWIDFVLFLHHGGVHEAPLPSPALLSQVSASSRLQCFYAFGVVV